MSQDEPEDLDLSQKKAALLSLLDASLEVNGHNDIQQQSPNASVSEENVEPGLFEPNYSTLQNEELMENGDSVASSKNCIDSDTVCHKNFNSTNVEREVPYTIQKADSFGESTSTKQVCAPHLPTTANFKREFQLALNNFTKGSKWSPGGSYPRESENSVKPGKSLQNNTSALHNGQEMEDGKDLPPSKRCKNSETEGHESAKEVFAPLLAINYEEEFKSSHDNFTKGCKWSPDGSCLLVASNDNTLRIFNLPSRVACGDIHDESWFFDESPKHVKPALTMREGNSIYDYTWYPGMQSSNADSCCFAVTCRGCPVHLWDAWHGKIICSYSPYDHLDELVAAHSVAFNLDGSKLYCGFNKSIRIFQVSRPGRDFVEVSAKDQPGIISCMAFNPVLPCVFVAGSYLGNLGFYNANTNSLFFRIDGLPRGITHAKFSSDGTKLFSGARANNEILCWDLRNPGKLLWSFRREVKTNQRIYFDLEPYSNNFLLSGTTNGTVVKWNIKDLPFPDGDEPNIIKNTSKFKAHKDCCNGVSLNPNFPVLATSSGQRHFIMPESLSSSESESEDRESFTHRKTKIENSVKLWWLG